MAPSSGACQLAQAACGWCQIIPMGLYSFTQDLREAQKGSIIFLTYSCLPPTSALDIKGAESKLYLALIFTKGMNQKLWQQVGGHGRLICGNCLEGVTT